MLKENKPMVVAGIGSRRGVTREQVLAAIDGALRAASLGRNKLAVLATVPLKQHEPAIHDAARALQLTLVVPEKSHLEDAAARIPATSHASLAATGLPSAAEAAALAAAGAESRLIAPRIAVGPVTCALAEGRP